MNTFLNRLSVSEIRLIALAVLVLAAGLLYVLVIEPLAQRHAAASEQLSREVALHAWIFEQAQNHQPVATAHAQPQASDAPPLRLSDIQSALTGADLANALDQMAPGRDGKVELAFKAVAFGDLVEWLQTGAAGAQVMSASLTATETSGLVDANVTLRLDRN